jgi:hypothetical protein
MIWELVCGIGNNRKQCTIQLIRDAQLTKVSRFKNYTMPTMHMQPKVSENIVAQSAFHLHTIPLI